MSSLRVFAPDDPGQPERPNSPTAQEVVDWFLARKQSTSRPALTEVRRILRLFVARFGPVPVNKLIGDDLVSFVESQPLVKKANSVARWYRTIKQPFNQAERLGKITVSPFKMVCLPRGDRGRDLSPVEFRALLRLANPSFRRVLIFLRYSGARPGELRELTWAMIVWSATGAMIVKRIHKTSATQRVPEPRKIHLPTQLVKLLLWLKRRSETDGYFGGRGGDYVFLNSKGTPWQIASLCTNLRTLRKLARFGDDVKLYGCRHAFGTGAILNGVDIATLAELMGHKHTSTTEIYIHLADKGDHLNSAVEKAIGKKKPPQPPEK